MLFIDTALAWINKTFTLGCLNWGPQLCRRRVCEVILLATPWLFLQVQRRRSPKTGFSTVSLGIFEFNFGLAIAWYPCYCVFMIISFKNQATEDIFNGKVTKSALRLCPRNTWKIAIRKLDQLDSVLSLDELRIPPGNRLESFSGDRRGQYSIRINDQYRICFKWRETGPFDVEIADYH